MPITSPEDLNLPPQQIDWTRALMGLGTMLGGVGHAVSGRRVPNAALQMQQMYDEHAQREIQTKIAQARLQTQKKPNGDTRGAVQLNKLRTGWEMIKDVRELVNPEDENAVTKAANLIASKMGDPEFATLAAEAIRDRACTTPLRRSILAWLRKPASQRPTRFSKTRNFTTSFENCSNHPGSMGKAQGRNDSRSVP